jgi:hypothetical protein
MRTTPRPSPVRRSFTAVALLAVALLSAGCTSTATASRDVPIAPSATAPSATAAPTSTPAPATPGTALALLATLPVKGRAPATGYQRTEDFGAAWLDVDRNGCDTRNDILARDLTGTVRQGSCRVLSGTLADPYTGRSIAFVRGERTSALVQIDHVVPLQNAWVTGAQQLSAEERIRLANDPLNLLAVDGAANQRKSAGDAATWLPANTAFRCAYVARQVSVKAAYRLWVTPPEHDAIARILSACPAQPAERSGLPAAAG